MAITIKAKFKCSSEKISQVPKDNLIMGFNQNDGL